MTRNLLSNPRRRGVIGAIIGATLPYANWATAHGLALGWDTEMQLFVLGFSIFFAILFYGIFHGGFAGGGLREPGGVDRNRWTEADAQNDDLVYQNDLHASSRTLWDNQYK
jgi:hypothetical protein